VEPASELPAAKEGYLAGQRAEKRRMAEKVKKREEEVVRERRREREERVRG